MDILKIYSLNINFMQQDIKNYLIEKILNYKLNSCAFLLNHKLKLD